MEKQAGSGAGRVGYFDIAKGIGIILVIIGHIEYVPAPIRFYIVTFHMPLFFIISGMLMNLTDEAGRDFKQLLLKKLKLCTWDGTNETSFDFLDESETLIDNCNDTVSAVTSLPLPSSIRKSTKNIAASFMVLYFCARNSLSCVKSQCSHIWVHSHAAPVTH